VSPENHERRRGQACPAAATRGRHFEIADELFLLRVDGDHGNAALDTVSGLLVDVLELRVAVGVLRAFYRLARRLKAVAMLAKQPNHRLVADPNAVLLEQLAENRIRVSQVNARAIRDRRE
jgi:hypothetical protein